MRLIQRVAVLGAGTMGSRIAAHFANAGIPSLLLDVSTELAKKGVENAAKQRPGGFFLDSLTSLVSPGNFESDLAASEIATGFWKPWSKTWRSSARFLKKWRRCASPTRSSPPTPAASRCGRSRKDSPPLSGAIF